MPELTFALDQLASQSPQLFGTLTRVYSGESKSISTAARCFALAIEQEGRLEIDFKRAPEVSFNPRAARVALILLKDGEESFLLSVACTMLASIPSLAEGPGLLSLIQELPQLEDALSLTRVPAERLVREFLQSSEEQHLRSAVFAVLCNHLDRLRHLHQAEQSRLQQVFEPLMRDSLALLQIAEKVSPPLQQRIAHWHLRVAPRLKKLVSPEE